MRARSAVILILPVLSGLAVAVSLAFASANPRTVVVSVGKRIRGVPEIHSGFVGTSMEYTSVAQVAGPAADPDGVVAQLIAQLAPGQTPILRIGGDSTDHAYWPASGVHDPDRYRFRITSAWLNSVRTLATSIHARLILGINLEADSRRLAATEAQALLSGLGSGSVQALELGNEPNLYSALYWYKTASGQKVYGRPPSYSTSQYLSQFSRVAKALPRQALADPALGSAKWMQVVLRPLLTRHRQIATVTYHRYPLNRCFTPRDSPTYPTVPHLMNLSSSRGLAATVKGYVRTAKAHGDRFRVDELNSVACSGEPGVSNTFASALWVVDTLFAMAREGVSGVNIHTLPTAAYRLFTVYHSGQQWSATVAPEYYGLLLFARAAPPGSRLLRASSSGSSEVRTWATGGHGKPTRVVLINASPRFSYRVRVEIPSAEASATLQRLRASGLRATGGVRLGGRAFAHETTTGILPGARLVTVTATHSSYWVTVPRASAALLTVPAS